MAKTQEQISKQWLFTTRDIRKLLDIPYRVAVNIYNRAELLDIEAVGSPEKRLDDRSVTRKSVEKVIGIKWEKLQDEIKKSAPTT